MIQAHLYSPRPLRAVSNPVRSRVCANCVKQIRQRASNAVLAGIAAAALLGPPQAAAASQLQFSPDVPLVRALRGARSKTCLLLLTPALLL